MEPSLFSSHHHLLVVVVLLLLLLPPAAQPSPRSPTNLVGFLMSASNFNVAVMFRKTYRIPWSLGAHRVRLLDADPIVVSTLAYSDVILNLSIDDEDIIEDIAANQTKACQWIHSMLLATANRINITAVSIGSKVLADEPPEFVDTLLKASNNMRDALDGIGLPDVPVTTSLTYDVVKGVFPPSASTFDDRLLPRLLRILDFLNRTNAPFQIELYPFQVFAQRMVPHAGIEYAMFEVGGHDEGVLTDPATGLRYLSILDMMIDSVVSSLDKVGFGGIPLEVSGTGWPWQLPDHFKIASANPLSSCEYISRVINFYGSRAGTPLRPYQPTVVYINGLLDDRTSVNSSQTGSMFLSYMGFMNADLSARCGINFTSQASDGAVVAPATTAATTVFLFWSFVLLLSS